jgi:hypothetical protein
MNANHEIVKVLNDAALINSESYECVYSTRQGKPLEPGFYIVLWPPRVISPSYDESAHYFGPFKSREQARVLLGPANH